MKLTLCIISDLRGCPQKGAATPFPTMGLLTPVAYSCFLSRFQKEGFPHDFEILYHFAVKAGLIPKPPTKLLWLACWVVWMPGWQHWSFSMWAWDPMYILPLLTFKTLNSDTWFQKYQESQVSFSFFVGVSMKMLTCYKTRTSVSWSNFRLQAQTRINLTSQTLISSQWWWCAPQISINPSMIRSAWHLPESWRACSVLRHLRSLWHLYDGWLYL